MATKKVGIYRKYHAGVPKDPSGQPLPKSPWPKKRLFIWAVRWFGADGNRYSKSFRNRKEAEAFAETKPSDVRSGRGDPPPGIRLREFVKEHERVMKGNVAASTLGLHLSTAPHKWGTEILSPVVPRLRCLQPWSFGRWHGCKRRSLGTRLFHPYLLGRGTKGPRPSGRAGGLGPSAA